MDEKIFSEGFSAEILQELGRKAVSSDKFYKQTVEYFNMLGELADGNPYTPFMNKLRYAFEKGISPEQIKLNLQRVLNEKTERQTFIISALRNTKAYEERKKQKQAIPAPSRQYTYVDNRRTS